MLKIVFEDFIIYIIELSGNESPKGIFNKFFRFKKLIPDWKLASTASVLKQ